VATGVQLILLLIKDPFNLTFNDPRNVWQVFIEHGAVKWKIFFGRVIEGTASAVKLHIEVKVANHGICLACFMELSKFDAGFLSLTENLQL
jgi:hypothetical protein